MRAKKCDRCGKLYEHYDGSKEFKNTEKANGVYLIDRDLDNEYWSRKSYDFCPDCMRKFEEFLLGGSVPKADEFKVVFPHGSRPGTVELGGETFRAYIGDYQENAVKTLQCTVTKRKFTVIEM